MYVRRVNRRRRLYDGGIDPSGTYSLKIYRILSWPSCTTSSLERTSDSVLFKNPKERRPGTVVEENFGLYSLTESSSAVTRGTVFFFAYFPNSSIR